MRTTFFEKYCVGINFTEPRIKTYLRHCQFCNIIPCVSIEVQSCKHKRNNKPTIEKEIRPPKLIYNPTSPTKAQSETSVTKTNKSLPTLRRAITPNFNDKAKYLNGTEINKSYYGMSNDLCNKDPHHRIENQNDKLLKLATIAMVECQTQCDSMFRPSDSMRFVPLDNMLHHHLDNAIKNSTTTHHMAEKTALPQVGTQTDTNSFSFDTLLHACFARKAKALELNPW